MPWSKTNPLAFMQGGLYGGYLDRDDKTELLLKSATASYGITALNELQRLYNGKSIVEDGEFTLDVSRYMLRNMQLGDYSKNIQVMMSNQEVKTFCELTDEWWGNQEDA